MVKCFERTIKVTYWTHGVHICYAFLLNMDEKSLNELLECSVCLERLDHTSKVLPCQHTFCRRCLDEIISTKRELRCPECRSLVEIRVDDLPTNILLIRLLEGLKTQNVTRENSPGASKNDYSPGNRPRQVFLNH